MQAEISHFVLIAAALCAVFLSLPTLLGSKSRAPLFVHLWKPALGITFAGLSFALIMLIWAFLTNDFSIAYVANNSNTKLDPVYNQKSFINRLVFCININRTRSEYGIFGTFISAHSLTADMVQAEG